MLQSHRFVLNLLTQPQNNGVLWIGLEETNSAPAVLAGAWFDLQCLLHNSGSCVQEIAYDLSRLSFSSGLILIRPGHGDLDTFLPSYCSWVTTLFRDSQSEAFKTIHSGLMIRD